LYEGSIQSIVPEQPALSIASANLPGSMSEMSFSLVARSVYVVYSLISKRCNFGLVTGSVEQSVSSTRDSSVSLTTRIQAPTENVLICVMMNNTRRCCGVFASLAPLYKTHDLLTYLLFMSLGVG